MCLVQVDEEAVEPGAKIAGYHTLSVNALSCNVVVVCDFCLFFYYRQILVQYPIPTQSGLIPTQSGYGRRRENWKSGLSMEVLSSLHTAHMLLNR
jgi:hypothetical protein